MRRLLILLAAALLAHAGALRGSFHFDDYSLLQNPLITSTSGLWRMWEPLQTRPLPNLTFWLNFHLGAANPVGYHIVNLLLHAGAVLLLFAALKLLISVEAAFWAAILFAVHPIQSEAVNYVFARSTLLSTAFCLASLYFWLRQRLIVSVAFFACALLSKEECVTFPILVLALTPLRERMRAFCFMMTLSLIAGARAAWATAHVSGSGAGFSAGITPWDYLAAQGAAVCHYLQLLIIPWGFTIEPTIYTSPVIEVITWVLVLCAIAAAYVFKKHYQFALWTLLGLLLLIPSSSVFPAADLAADRRMYLPMVAFSAAFGLLTPLLGRYAPPVIALALAVLSVLRAETWRTEENLWKEAVDRSPAHVRPLVQLSRVVPDSEAVSILDRARALEPKNSGLSAELGRVWLKSGRYDLALKEFGVALALDPKNANAFNNRGAALMGLRQRNAAKLDFERALKLDPCVFAARKNLEALGVTGLPTCPATAK